MYSRHMSHEVNTQHDREQVVTLARAVRDMRAALERLEASRDAAIRRYVAANSSVNRSELARDLGLSRTRFYGVLDPQVFRNQDDELDFSFEALDRADALWNAALERWEEAERVGDIDDYFPLDQASL